MHLRGASRPHLLNQNIICKLYIELYVVEALDELSSGKPGQRPYTQRGTFVYELAGGYRILI